MFAEQTLQVIGDNNNTNSTSPVSIGGIFSAGSENAAHSQDPPDPPPHSEQAPLTERGATLPVTENHSAEDKQFATAYGMVVWPTLPGMASAVAGTPTKPVHALQGDDNPSTPQSEQRGAMASVHHRLNGNPTSMYQKQPLLRAACDSCHRMKRKCDGKHPCTRCERRNRDCFYSCKQKSGPPKGSKRKLVEAEDDLPENRSTKVNPHATWPLGNGSVDLVNYSASSTPAEAAHVSHISADMGPSPEARAAAAAAMAASRMTGMASGVSPALAAAGLRSPYMLRPSSVLPGLSGGSVPVTAPLVTHPQYGTVYQHQYPPEVYAVYLAELRQRGCSPALAGGITSNATPACTSSATPAPISGHLGIPRQPSPVEATQAAASALAADVAAATAVAGAADDAPAAASSGNTSASKSGRGLLTEAIDIMEKLGTLGGTSASPSTGASGGDLPRTDGNVAGHRSTVSRKTVEESPNEPARAAAASAAASAALAAAVAAARAEASPLQVSPSADHGAACPPDGPGGAFDDGHVANVTSSSTSPIKGSRFDALPDIAVVATATDGRSPTASSAATEASVTVASPTEATEKDTSAEPPVTSAPATWGTVATPVTQAALAAMAAPTTPPAPAASVTAAMAMPASTPPMCPSNGSSGSSCRETATHRERQAAVGLMLYGMNNRSSASPASASDAGDRGSELLADGPGELRGMEGPPAQQGHEFQQKLDTPKAATQVMQRWRVPSK